MFERILLPISGSEESIVASEFAIKLATVHKSIIFAMTVVDTSAVRQIARVSGKTPGEVEIDLEENGWHHLYYIEELAKDSAVRINLMLELGLPQEKILRKAKDLKVDLIILGQTSKRGMPGISLDRFVQSILEQAPCPVLTIK
ncbi:TPA: universal stress protein [bacterium]|nr:universal stress protein [bacterium]